MNSLNRKKNQQMTLLRSSAQKSKFSGSTGLPKFGTNIWNKDKKRERKMKKKGEKRQEVLCEEAKMEESSDVLSGKMWHEEKREVGDGGFVC